MEGDGGDRGNDTVIIQPVKLVKSLQGLCRYSNVGSIPTKGSQSNAHRFVRVAKSHLRVAPMRCVTFISVCHAALPA